MNHIKTRFTPNGVGEFARENSSLLLLLIMILIATIFTNNFLTIDNILNLFRRISINGVVAVGFTIVLLTGGFDLSLGSTLSLCAVLAVGLESQIGALPAILVALAAGIGVGLLNGILMKITRGGLGEAFVITLGTSLLGTSLALTYTNGYDLAGVNAGWYRAIGQGNFLRLPIAGLIWFAIMIIVQIFIKKTTMGRKLILSGGNKKAAFLAGVDVNKIKVWAFTLAGLLAAVGAIMMVSLTRAASPRSGDSADFDAAIAAVVGGNSLIGGKGGMIQVFIGVVIYGLITNILNLAGVNTVVQYIIEGTILAVAIGLDHLKRR